MAQFLKLVAQDIYNKFKNNLENATIVIPSKRPEYYIYRYLSQISTNEIFAPKITTFNELIDNWSDLIPVNNLELIYHLFIVYKTHLPGEETFDDFYFWGELILSDFNDIDEALAEPDEILKLVKEVKQIEEIFEDKELTRIIEQFWKTFYSGEKTKLKTRFLKFWEELLPIYQQYNKYLSERKIAYHGMSTKNAINNLNKGSVKLPDTDFIFVGFDHLTNAEKTILKFIKNNGKAHFYWDYDESFLDEKYEAGSFIRENLKMFPSSLSISNFNNFKNTKNINIYEVPGMSGVAQLAIDNAAETRTSEISDPDFTAVILADANILQPMLSKLPKAKNINITTGWPVKYSSSSAYATVFLNIWTQQINNKNQNRLSTDLLLKIANSKGIILEDSNLITEKCTGKIFVDINEFRASEWLYKSLLIKNETVASKLTTILKKYIIINNDSGLKETVENKFDLESAQHIITHLTQFSNVIENCNIDIQINTQAKLIERLINTLSLPFEGSPLSGIQITSISETKCLDFENVIIAGANEGIIPSATRRISHIPYSIRKSFGLPTFDDDISLTAYQMYRLMQRPKNITFIVNSDDQEIEKAEPTRFLQQFVVEQNWNFEPKKTYDFQIVSKLAKPISYSWDEKVSGYMGKIRTKGISPTAINTYIDCPLKFYFKYPCNLNEPKIAENVMDSRIFGNLLHKSIEILYKNLVNETVSTDSFNKLLESNIIQSAVESIALETDGFNKHSGYNKILQQIIIEYITQIIKIDAKIAPMKIVGLEQEVKIEFQIGENTDSNTVILKGNIDRIDQVNGKTRILDYKTGNPDVSIDKDLINLFDNTKSKRNREALQAFIYAIIYSTLTNNTTPYNITMGLVISRKVADNNFSFFNFSGKKENIVFLNDIIEPLKDNLKAVLGNMFNKANCFEQTENRNTCTYCPYKQICQR